MVRTAQQPAIAPKSAPVSHPDRREEERTRRRARVEAQVAAWFEEGSGETPGCILAAGRLLELMHGQLLEVSLAHQGRSWRCHLVRGPGLTPPPRHPWLRNQTPTRGARALPIRHEVESGVLSAGAAPPERPAAIGAATAFHTSFYPPGATASMGWLSVFSGAELALTPDHVALAEAVAHRFSELAGAGHLPGCEPLTGGG